MYAVGTYSKSVGVYLEDQRGHCLCLLEGQTGGVTQIKFTADGTFLLAGGRKDREILVWDMRNPGAKDTKRKVFILTRDKARGAYT